ncbi:hypothetical protein EDC04DRAFT_2900940 [Pisolithus marmoratus]|nr:hypothetical protein EDC04DRAFT_2900940 [Pisolithus marmoratus]
MAFLKALFGNSTDIQDESFALESLETPASTVDLIRAGSTPVMAAPMDAVLTLTPVTPTDPTPMDAQPTLIPVIPAGPTLTPVTPTDPTSMDAQPTLIPVIPTGPTLKDAGTTSTPMIPASIVLMDTNTTLTATPTNVIPMNANIVPTTTGDNTLGPLLVQTSNSTELTLGVDYYWGSVFVHQCILSGLEGGKGMVYDLKKGVLKAQFTILEGKFHLKDAGTSELEAQIRQRDVIITKWSQLLSQLRKDLDEVKWQTAAQNSVLAQVESKDAVIAQQSEALQKLQRDLNEVWNQVVLEAKAEIQQLQVDRESELLALNQKYETTLHKLQESVTKAFIEGTGPGPGPSQLQWDFNNPALSAWNQAVISQLMCWLVEMQQKLTIETQSDQYWVHKITQKFTQIKKCVDRAKPHINNNLSVKTSADIAKRLVNEKDEALMKARRDMQRQTKYQHQKEIMENMVAVKEAKGDDNVVAWQFLSSVIAMLGSDGMSSEDSDGEDTKTVYCTHMLPWRRDIVKELNLIDQQRLKDSSIFSPRGAKAVKHIRSDKFLQSEWKPVKGLPCPFYDAGWLAWNKEMCSDVPFCWMTIYAQS